MQALQRDRNSRYAPNIGTAFVHIDHHSRVAYAEVRDDETAATAIDVLRNAVAWFAGRGVTVERVLSGNGSAYRSHAWREACHHLGIKPKKTRPYRLRTNGKVERFHRTMTEGWAPRRFYNSEHTRRAALPAWLHHYNHHRPHTATSGKPPTTRLTNVPGSTASRPVAAGEGSSSAPSIAARKDPTGRTTSVSPAPVRTDREPIAKRFPHLGDFAEAHWQAAPAGIDTGGVSGPTDMRIEALVVLRPDTLANAITGYEWQPAPPGWTPH
ncbi:Integrase core domain-containing protein [Micromonospora nigra]|uniref:Integrase core domain-containing protein n=1 Tax=Micromonospora nigra TaxID=145857 RepID=A0A1C6RBK0_9ACTN|nr:Integrase core domain-containing protein [Micromonospora nigra]